MEDRYRTLVPVPDISEVKWEPILEKKLRDDLATSQTTKDHFSQGIDFHDLDFFEENGLWLFAENAEF